MAPSVRSRITMVAVNDTAADDRAEDAAKHRANAFAGASARATTLPLTTLPSSRSRCW